MRTAMAAALVLSFHAVARAAAPSHEDYIRKIHDNHVHDMKEAAKLPPPDYGDLVLHDGDMKLYMKKAGGGRPERRFLIVPITYGAGPDGTPLPEILTNVERLGAGGPEKFASVTFAAEPVDLRWCHANRAKRFSYQLYGLPADPVEFRRRGVLYYKCTGGGPDGFRPVMWWGLPRGTRLDDGDPVQNSAKTAKLFPEPKAP